MRGISSLIQWLHKRWSKTWNAGNTAAVGRFPNVPDKLTVFVREHMLEFQRTGNRDLLYLEAAGGVIRQYLERNVFDKDADPFLGANAVNLAGDLWYGYPLRVILIGETLFLLRSCKGFAEICRRLRTRDFRPAYYEMLAAKAFFRAGFDIDVRPEIGRLGSDFDFAAIRSEITINGEVTALEEKDFYENTAINALGRKRRQLPADNPAVIFCIIPAQWEKIGKDLNLWSETVAKQFLSSTRRINAVVFQLERHIDISTERTTGGFMVVSRPFINPNPRFPCDLDFILRGRGPSSEGQQALESAVGRPEQGRELAKWLRVGEFYEWVDSLVP
jgi:hypothetical protein